MIHGFAMAKGNQTYFELIHSATAINSNIIAIIIN